MVNIVKKLFGYIESNILYKCCYNLLKHEALEFAGYLTYLTVLSIFPFIFIVFAFISTIDETKYGVEFFAYILNNVPPYFRDTFGKQITDIGNGPSVNLMNVAIIGAIWTASSSVEALKSIFNRIYLVQANQHYIIGRLTSILQFMTFVFAILLALIAFIVLPELRAHLPEVMQFKYLGGQFNIVFLNMFLCLIVAMIYYVLTRARISFLSTIPGAIITVTVWNISSESLSYYMSNFRQVSLMYGSLASVIITLIFFYIINVALIFGAEFNRLLSVKR